MFYGNSENRTHTSFDNDVANRPITILNIFPGLAQTQIRTEDLRVTKALRYLLCHMGYKNLNNEYGI